MFDLFSIMECFLLAIYSCRANVSPLHDATHNNNTTIQWKLTCYSPPTEQSLPMPSQGIVPSQYLILLAARFAGGAS